MLKYFLILPKSLNRFLGTLDHLPSFMVGTFKLGTMAMDWNSVYKLYIIGVLL